MTTLAQTAGLAQLPDDNMLGVVGRFQKNPVAVFEQMEGMGAPLVRFRLAHKKPIYVASLEALREMMRYWQVYQKNTSETTRTLLGNGLVFAEGEEWATQRRIISPAFHRQAISSYVDIMREHTLERMQVQQRGLVDMSRVFHEIAIRVVRDTLFGTQNDAVELQRVLDGTLYMLNHIVKQRKNPLSPPLWMPTPANRKALKYHREIERVVRKAMEEKQMGHGGGTSMLEMMLSARDEESAQGLSQANIIDQVKIFFVAGTDTSSNTLAWAFYLLQKHPEVEHRLREEIATVLGTEAVGMDDLPKLPYLRAVIQETLRMYPATWINARQPNKDVILEGIALPKGTSLVFSPYTLHRKPELWEAPDTFRPERFVGMETLPVHYMPFLAGPRRCIGDQFAMTEMMVILATLIQHFRWEFPAGFEAQPAWGSTLGMAAPLMTNLTSQTP